MSEKRLESLDLNLLLALHWLLNERNVTAAAGQMGLSQPAASRALSKLRLIFEDPLLVKTGGQMSPTRLGERLQPMVAHAVERFRDVLRVRDTFEPAQQNGAFRIACSDYVGAMVAKSWATTITPEAPHMSLDVTTPTLEACQELATGKLDLTILPDLSALDLPASVDTEAFVQRPILKQSYKSAISRFHPLAGKKIDLETYLSLDHILVSPDNKPTGLVDRVLRREGLERKIAYRTTTFLLAFPILKHTECVMTGPMPLLNLLSDMLYMFDPPIDIRPTTLYGVWHPNWTHDDRHKWTRNKLFGALSHQEVLAA